MSGLSPLASNIIGKRTIGNNIHTSVCDKRYDFGFPIHVVNFPWLSGGNPGLPLYGIYISQLVRFARCFTSIFDFHSKNLQITSKLLTQGYRYHKLRKTFGKFFRSNSEHLSKLGAISFQEYVSKYITHPVFYGDLVFKLREGQNSHSQKCDPTRRKSCRTHSFVSKKHFDYFSEHIFCSIRQLTCVHHVQRIVSTL